MTSLQTQLNALASRDKTASAPFEGKRSLIYDGKFARTLDAKAFYDVGMNGLLGLEEKDRQFEQFEKTLFSPDKINYHRSMNTKETNAGIDAEVSRLLKYLSPFFLLRSAHMVLEYLIQNFQINQHSLDDIMLCMLPYHNSEIFVRMLQVLILQTKTNKKWGFLISVAKDGTRVSPAQLAHACVYDVDLLSFIVSSYLKLANTHVADPEKMEEEGKEGDVPQKGKSFLTRAQIQLMLSLCSYAISERVDFNKRQRIIQIVLPFLVAGFQHQQNSDLFYSASILFCQMCSMKELDNEKITRLLSIYARNVQTSKNAENAAIKVLLCTVQFDGVKAFTKEILYNLFSKWPAKEFAQSIAEVTDYDVVPLYNAIFMTYLTANEITEQDWKNLKFFIVFAPSSANNCHKLFPLSAKKLVEGLFSRFYTTENKDAVSLIRFISYRFPNETDEAISSFINTDPEDENRTTFINGIFSGTTHQFMNDEDGSGVLAVNINSANTLLREKAVLELPRIAQLFEDRRKENKPQDIELIEMSEDELNEKTKELAGATDTYAAQDEFLCSSLSMRFKDDNIKIVALTLSALNDSIPLQRAVLRVEATPAAKEKETAVNVIAKSIVPREPLPISTRTLGLEVLCKLMRMAADDALLLESISAKSMKHIWRFIPGTQVKDNAFQERASFFKAVSSYVHLVSHPLLGKMVSGEDTDTNVFISLRDSFAKKLSGPDQETEPIIKNLLALDEEDKLSQTTFQIVRTFLSQNKTINLPVVHLFYKLFSIISRHIPNNNTEKTPIFTEKTFNAAMTINTHNALFGLSVLMNEIFASHQASEKEVVFSDKMLIDLINEKVALTDSQKAVLLLKEALAAIAKSSCDASSFEKLAYGNFIAQNFVSLSTFLCSCILPASTPLPAAACALAALSSVCKKFDGVEEKTAIPIAASVISMLRYPNKKMRELAMYTFKNLIQKINEGQLRSFAESLFENIESTVAQPDLLPIAIKKALPNVSSPQVLEQFLEFAESDALQSSPSSSAVITGFVLQAFASIADNTEINVMGTMEIENEGKSVEKEPAKQQITLKPFALPEKLYQKVMSTNAEKTLSIWEARIIELYLRQAETPLSSFTFNKPNDKTFAQQFMSLLSFGPTRALVISFSLESMSTSERSVFKNTSPEYLRFLKAAKELPEEVSMLRKAAVENFDSKGDFNGNASERSVYEFSPSFAATQAIFRGTLYQSFNKDVQQTIIDTLIENMLNKELSANTSLRVLAYSTLKMFTVDSSLIEKYLSAAVIEQAPTAAKREKAKPGRKSLKRNRGEHTADEEQTTTSSAPLTEISLNENELTRATFILELLDGLSKWELSYPLLGKVVKIIKAATTSVEVATKNEYLLHICLDIYASTLAAVQSNKKTVAAKFHGDVLKQATATSQQPKRASTSGAPTIMSKKAAQERKKAAEQKQAMMASQDVESAAISEKIYELDSLPPIIACISLLSSPQSLARALNSVSATAVLCPRAVLREMNLVLTTISERAIGIEDRATYAALQRSLASLVTPLLAGEKGALPLIQTLAQCYEKIPKARRVSLFTPIITAIPSSCLSALVTLVFAKVVKTKESEAAKQENAHKFFFTDELDFFHELLLPLGPIRSAQLLAEVGWSAAAIALAIKGDAKEGIISGFAKPVADALHAAQCALNDYYYIKRSERTLIEQHVLSCLIVKLIGDHFAHKMFVESLLTLNNIDEEQMQKRYSSAFEALIALSRLSQKGTEGSKKLQRYGNELLAAAQEALQNLVLLQPVTVFVNSLLPLVTHADSAVRVTALAILNARLSELGERRAGDVEAAVLLSEGGLLQSIRELLDNPAYSDKANVRQTALLALEILARTVGHLSPQSFIPAFNSIVNVLLNDTTTEVVSSAALSLATFSTVLGAHALPRLAEFVPRLIELVCDNAAPAMLKSVQNKRAASQESTRTSTEDEPTCQISALSSLAVITRSLGRFLSPHLASLLASIFSRSVICSPNKKLVTLGSAVLMALSETVEPRLLLRSIYKLVGTDIIKEQERNIATEEVISTNPEEDMDDDEDLDAPDAENATTGTASRTLLRSAETLAHLCLFLDKVITRLNATELVGSYKHITYMLIALFSERLCSELEDLDKSFRFKPDECTVSLADWFDFERASVSMRDFMEASAIQALTSLVVRLNENTFKPLFLSIISPLQSTKDTDVEVVVSQSYKPVSLYRLIHALARTLRSLFVPYFSYILDDCTARLSEKWEAQAKDEEKDESDEEQTSSKNKNKDDDDNKTTEAGKKRKSKEMATPEQRDELTLGCLVLHCLELCFLSDTTGLCTEQQRIETLAPAIVGMLDKIPYDASGLSPPAVETRCVACCTALASCSGSDECWRLLTREYAARSHSRAAAVRAAAARGMRALWERIGDEMATVLPDTLPCLGELMEDAAPEVEHAAQQLAAEIQEHLGERESLRSYL